MATSANSTPVNTGRSAQSVATGARTVTKLLLDIKRQDVARVEIVDTDFVLTLKSGRKVLVRDGALRTTLDQNFVLVFLDEEVGGKALFDQAQAQALSPNATWSEGTPPGVMMDSAAGTPTSPIPSEGRSNTKGLFSPSSITESTPLAFPSEAAPPITAPAATAEPAAIAPATPPILPPAQPVPPVVAEESSSSYGWLGALGLLGAIGAAGGRAASAAAATTSADSGSSVGVLLNIFGAAGPLIGEQTVKVYSANGTQLLGQGTIKNGQAAKIYMALGFTGSVLLKLEDSNGSTTADYQDEYSHTAQSLNTTLRALAQVSKTTGEQTFVITPVTELAVRNLEAANGGALPTLTEPQVKAQNSAVAKYVGLTGLDITGTMPTMIVNADGTKNANYANGNTAGEQYGKVLTQLSANDASTGGAAPTLGIYEGILKSAALTDAEKISEFARNLLQGSRTFESSSVNKDLAALLTSDASRVLKAPADVSVAIAKAGLAATMADGFISATDFSATALPLAVALPVEAVEGDTVKLVLQALDAQGQAVGAAIQGAAVPLTQAQILAGFVSLDLKGMLTGVDGRFSIAAVVVNKDDNTSVQYATYKLLTGKDYLQVDTTPPVVGLLELAGATVENATRYTNNAKPTFNWTGLSSDTDHIDVSLNGKSYTVRAVNGVWQLKIPEALHNALGGTQAFTATYTTYDAAGNASLPFDLPFSVRLTASLRLTPDSDTGTAEGNGSNTDGITRVTTPTWTGQVPGDVVKVTVALNGKTYASDVAGLYKITLNADGSFGFTVPAEAALPNGFTAKPLVTMYNSAGVAVTAPEAGVQTIVIDTANPSAGANLASSADSGASNSDGVTNVNHPTLSGTTDKGAKVSVTLNGVTQTALADESTGAWSLTWATTLADGNYTPSISVTDKAGNTSGAVNGTPFAVDTKAPAAINSVVVGDNQLSAGETTTVTFTFASEPIAFGASSVDVLGGVITTWSSPVAPAQAGGAWTVTATFVPTQNYTGPASVTVKDSWYVDAAGNVANDPAADPLVANDGVSFLVDTQPPSVVISASTSGQALKVGDQPLITFAFAENPFAGSYTLQQFQSDVQTSSGALGSWTSAANGSGWRVTALLTPTSANALSTTVSVGTGKFSDAFGNLNVGATLTLTGDTLAPSVEVLTDVAQTSASAHAVLFTFKFSEPPIGFSLADDLEYTFPSGVTSLAQLGSFGALSSVTMVNGQYVYTATFNANAGIDTKSLGVKVKAAGFVDGGGNANAASNLVTLLVDTVSRNAAPVLGNANVLALTTVDEDAAAPTTGTAGQVIETWATSSILSDTNSADSLGIAITKISTQGTLYYKLAGSSNWTEVVSVGAQEVSSTQALLLQKNASLYFKPAENFNGNISTALEFRGWDGTAGTQGGRADTTVNGGTSAFSANSRAVQLTVTSVNDAPVLSVVPDLQLIMSTNSAATAPSDAMAGALVSTLMSAFGGNVGPQNVTDVDDAIFGMAIVSTNAAATGRKLWYKTSDSSTWTEVTDTLSASNVLLLGAADRVYFQTESGFNGSLSDALIVRAWDGDTGTAGSRVDLSAASSVGGRTAFSVGTDTVQLIVNSAPTLDATQNLALSAVDEDVASPVGAVGSLVSSLLTGMADADSPSIVVKRGIAVTAYDGADGTLWWGTLSNGAWSWATVGAAALSESNALHLKEGDRLFYQGKLNLNGSYSAAVTLVAWDRSNESVSLTSGTQASVLARGGSTAYSSNSDTVSILINAVNDAPTLTAVNTLLGFTEDTYKEITYTDLTNAADEADVDSASLSFQIDAISSGSLQKWTNGAWVDAAAGVTISTGDKLQWKGALNANGELNAFTVKATDGALLSSTAIQVKAAVAPVNDAPVFKDAAAPIPTPIVVPRINDGMTTAPTSSADGFKITDAINPSVLFSDVDAAVGSLNTAGVAITTLQNNLALYFSTNSGSSWTLAGSLSDSNPLLLQLLDTTRLAVRVTGGGRLNADLTNALTVRLWDQTQGSVGVNANFASGTSLSAASRNASLQVNHLPSLGSLSPATVADTPQSGNETLASTSGTVQLTDLDASAAHTWTLVGGFVTSAPNLSGQTELTAVGTYGTLVFNTVTKAYVYTPDSAKVDALKVSTSVQDQFTLGVTDNLGAQTSTAFNVALTGANDIPVVTVTPSVPLALVEQGSGVSGTNTASVTITTADADQGESPAVALSWMLTTYGMLPNGQIAGGGWISSNGGQTYTREGVYGAATYTVSTGAVTYTLNNSKADTQALKAGASVQDNFFVRFQDSQDGAITVTQQISFTINGSNDAPTMSAPANFALTEDVQGSLIFTGTPFGDVDADDILTVTLAVATGTLTVTAPSGANGGTGVGIGAGGSAASQTFTGTAANLNAYFAQSTSGVGNIRYQGATDANGTVTLNVSVKDAQNATITSAVGLIISAVNDAPVVTVGTVQPIVNAPEDTVTLVSAALGDVAYGPGGGSDETSQTLTYTITALPSGTLGALYLADGTTLVQA